MGRSCVGPAKIVMFKFMSKVDICICIFSVVLSIVVAVAMIEHYANLAPTTIWGRMSTVEKVIQGGILLLASSGMCLLPAIMTCCNAEYRNEFDKAKDKSVNVEEE